MTASSNVCSVDILIVGAGASGAAAAWSLSESGRSVMCIEQGDYVNPQEFPTTKLEWEVMRAHEFSFLPNTRKLAADYPINDKESPIAIANFNGVGGSTVLYSGHFPRFHPSDFKTKTLDGVADDWPLTYAQLEPYFKLNDHMMGVSGLSGDPAYPPIDGMMPPVPLGKMGERIAAGFNKLGWHWWPAYSAIITRDYGGRQKCINLGPCDAGCSQGAKSSVDVTYWPLARRNGVVLKTGCRVREITVNEQGQATGAIYYDQSGAEVFQNAKIVILAANGVGTPRLMLNSRSNAFPDGLANRSGLVGRNLMLHPLGYVEGLFHENLDSQIGPHGCCLSSMEFYETDATRGFVRGYTMQILRGAGPLETALAGVARREIPLGPQHHEAFAARFGHSIGLAVIVEDLPEPENRVTLDPDQVDGHGIPGAKINYRLSENSKKMLAHGLNMGKKVMTAAGAWRNLAFGPVRNTGWHLMGTTRMGVDPKNSVVNEFGACHEVRNLYIVDSSIFVTSGGVNPVATMQALSLYIADHIKKDLPEILQ